ncbi:MAG TPA: transporter substrate-binding domain-containing protein [Edaphocola sp.]|nr:transporter substrate-binding domain-containing protein [Edaphocola sp.]
MKSSNTRKTKSSKSPLLFLSSLVYLLFTFYSSDLNAKQIPLRVGIAGSAPFVIHKDSIDDSGIAIEIWENIAAKANFEYASIDYNDVSSALRALQLGEVDVVIGPLSITAQRMEFVRFTQPFFQSGLSIVSRSEHKSLIDRIKPFFSFKLIIAISVFLFILGLVGTFFWLAERKHSPEQFPMKAAPGIANGMWLAIVTMSTTGYGDRAPITFWGRVIAGSWMVISIIFATSMVAGIASTLTLTGLDKSEITMASELNKQKTGVIENSPAEEFAEEKNAKIIKIKNLEDGYQKLLDKEIDALLFDRTQVLYFLKQNSNESISISPYEYDKLGYGFATQLNSDLTHQINIHLLHMAESGKLTRILHSWLGDYEKSN